MNDRMKAALSIVESATPLLLEGYALVPGSDPARRETLGTSLKKSPQDLVTEYDKRVEAFLTDKLTKAFPGEVIIGEEAMAEGKQGIREACEKHEAFWVIDPIDGTTNYARAYPFFSSTIAFLSRTERGLWPEIGIVYNPLNKEMFWACDGGGAWLNRHRLQVTQVVEPQQALLTTGFASLRSTAVDDTFELFRKLTKKTLGVRRDGSAALDLAFVAAGRIDAYWEWGLSPWDTAAGALLVTEAGGQVSHHDGEAIDLLTGEILASNGRMHEWLIKSFAGEIA